MVQTAGGRCGLFTVAIVDVLLLYGCRLLATGTRKHGVVGTNKRSGCQCGFVEVEVEPYTKSYKTKCESLKSNHNDNLASLVVHDSL